MDLFTAVVDGFKWLGKEIVAVPKFLAKSLVLANDVKVDAEAILPEVITLVEDVDAVAVAAVKDSGTAITAIETLVGAIVDAAKVNGVDINKDDAVVVAFQAFIAQVTNQSNFVDVINAVKALVAQYDVVGGTVKAAIAKLESDAS